MSTTLLLLGILYFVQGIPYGLQSSLLPVYLRTVGLSFTKISLTKALYFPWTLKVVWAPFVDQYGTKQRWLLISMCGLAMCCLLCASLSPESDFQLVAAVFLFMNFFASVQDVAVDGLAVRILRYEEVGYGNTVQVVGYKIGSVLAGGGLLTVMDLLGWTFIFFLLTGIYLVAIIYASSEFGNTSVNQPCGGKKPSRTLNPMTIVKDFIAVPATTWTVIFVLIYKLGEQGAISMFPLFLLDHSFSAQELGFWNGMVAMGFSIIGSSLGGILMSKYRALPLIKILFFLRLGSLFFQTIVVFMFDPNFLIWKSAAVLSISLQHFLGGLITTVTFSIMMHCTQKADEKIQATHYSFLATLEVLGKLSFSTFVGVVVDWIGLPASFLLFLILSVLALVHVLKAPTVISC
ncbi:major facilitator superfamily domain-containing protein 3 isoform X1 [Protopterus annectens]|uniref:major facilitator superfamily domain-containing protein 3 isoform X1 n=1 Tax=Protopterus annectens TaxID=7888 RepID=UPI001CF9D160|nr:major facilitator superfamily domain-containing protein 3 isoform X1 [Protopterus annectens]XP_043916773.1 major facilitator superfamily domain-containing protein 3 isoform X1 [Protopterus annectens]XP_043916774.1 major facilitator superfamily domain-containing protein 3 isoform X1 [Protopterus annectens]XP_043916775.1 major facilitator superfamily domain-containing protein 3 isoform X1 [Protopterus annectens]XP_043916776.1 major facilitator superfamily domain-containing protein 3 isoform X1